MSSAAVSTHPRFSIPVGIRPPRGASRKRLHAGAAARAPRLKPSWNATRNQESKPARAQAPSEELVTKHLGQVHMIAKKIRSRLPAYVELDDLIGYGTVGLMHAVEGFDPARGTQLKTYAEHRIRGAILDGLRGMNWLSRGACKKKVQMERDSRAAGADSTLHPQAVFATSASMSLPDHGADPADSGALPPLAAPRTNRGPTLIEILCGGWFLEDLEQISERAGWRQAAGMGSPAADPESIYLRKEQAERVDEAVRHLPARERALVEMRYEREMSMLEISRILGVHPSRVSQLHRRAMQRLQERLGGEAGTIPQAIPANSCEAIAVPEVFQSIG